MKLIALVLLLMTAAANAAITFLEENINGVYVSVTLLDDHKSFRYYYDFSLTGVRGVYFEMADQYQPPPSLWDTRGASYTSAWTKEPGWMEFLRDFSQDQIDFIAFTTDKPPARTYQVIVEYNDDDGLVSAKLVKGVWAPIPEPSVLALLLPASLTLFRRRR